MIKERAWPAKAMYMLIAAALAISLIIMVAPAQKVSASPGLSEWTRVDTPTTDGWVLAPCTVIIDYALADGGEVAYAIVDQWQTDCPDPCYDDGDVRDSGPYLLKSDDYAATWDDITDAIESELDDTESILALVSVATDWVDPDFVAVAVALNVSVQTALHVFFSTDGGDTFEDIGEVADGVVYLDWVSDLAVSYAVDDEREIAIGGQEWNGSTYTAGLFRCTVTGDSAGAWEDATEFDGWDDDGTLPYGDSFFVTDIIFSTSWATDKTILVTTIADDSTYDTVYLQCGSWGGSPGWNEWSTLGIEAVPILENEALPLMFMYIDGRAIAGITLPEDYDSDNSDDRILWVWVNYYDSAYPYAPMCQITRVEDDDAGPLIGGAMAQIDDGEVWLTNVSYKGTIAEGEAIAGVLGTGTIPEYGNPMDLFAECCEGVQVYHNDGIHDMDICCERWHDACKPPTGRAAMAVSYVGEDKAYAVALQGEPCGDEGAWSVTFDDGDTWNQLSLIDTFIDYFSDVAVSPDCNKTMLVSVNIHKVCIEYNDGEPDGEITDCDSVWLHADTLPEAEEYSGQWLRTWSGRLWGDMWDGPYVSELDSWGWEGGMLRLAPEETTGDNVYLFDYYTNNVYWNDMETLACWDSIKSTELDHIVDLAAQDADTLFALDENGDVAMFDDDEWNKAVESKVDAGWTIAVWGDWVLVGGRDGEVSYSDDGGETFTALDDVYDDDSKVTVAFDTYFDTNSVIYAAVEAWGGTPYKHGGIYKLVIGADDEEWFDLKAEPYEYQVLPKSMWTSADGDEDTVEVAFTGIVVDRPGNPYTSSDNGGVIYATYYGSVAAGNRTDYCFTGVARSLEREVTVCTTCLTWDYLQEGLSPGDCYSDCPYPEGFEAPPDALKICGCLTPDTNSHLFAIDAWWEYDFCDNDFGSVWTYEDCYAKKAPDITYPADGDVIPADPCSCYSVPFTVLWDSICDACSYDIAFALDEDFEMPVKVNGETIEVYHVISDTPSYSVMGGEAGGLSCETTYYVRVRAADAATDEIIHSWWSDPIEITIAPSVEAGIITLVSPEPGALNQPTKNLGFSWDLQATADAFDWVLSENADLSTPLDSKTGLTSKATSYAGTLDHGTTYYWQVMAYNEGAPIGTSAVGTFTTSETGPYCAQDGVCFDTLEELQNYNEENFPVQPTTPTWVWVVIAIGAVLVIVVIVLIFRTRRV
jgi:hypothetical protein